MFFEKLFFSSNSHHAALLACHHSVLKLSSSPNGSIATPHFDLSQRTPSPKAANCQSEQGGLTFPTMSMSSNQALLISVNSSVNHYLSKQIRVPRSIRSAFRYLHHNIHLQSVQAVHGYLAGRKVPRRAFFLLFYFHSKYPSPFLWVCY